MSKSNKTAVHNFQKLTPVQDASIEIYSEALDFVFENDDVRNIAITGTYGSGKSSIIETYEKQHSERKFIHLSLAHFDQEDLRNSDSKTDNKDIRTIEGQLINQLINQIPKENIPETQFSIKRDRNKKRYKTASVLISLCLLIIIFLFHHEEIMDYVLHIQTGWLKAIFLFFLKPDFIVFRMLLLSLPFAYVIYKLSYFLAGKKYIKKINLKGNEIVLFDDQNDSFFDKYLNEILYLFENAKADGIVFEDIDRYSNTLVFERLREINVLLHQRKKLKMEEAAEVNKVPKTRKDKKAENIIKPIRFFYLIRDDLFENNVNKDRTKFFDFIIPIVPVVDGNNSYDVLSILFSEYKEICDVLDKRFLRRVCVYIDDYRILKNIYNEFLIYKGKLGGKKFDNNKLFAIIVYKNIFPHDFAELQFNRGYIYTLFKYKNRCISSYNKYWIDEVKRINQEWNEYNTEKDNEIYELKELDEEKMKVKHGDETKTWRNEYSRRKKLIEKEREEREQELESLKRQYEENKLSYGYHPMNELLKKTRFEDTINKIIKTRIGEKAYESIRRNHYYPLLMDILKKGQIDETYPDYISIRYPGALTTNDMRFVRKVIGQEETSASEYTYHLNEPEKIMECLDDTDFSHSAILNHDLVDCLLTKEQNKTIQTILQHIWYRDKEDFIIDYLRSGKNIDKMIKIIVDPNTYGLYAVGKIADIDIHWSIIYTTVEKRIWNNDDPTEFKEYVGSKSACIDKYAFQLTNKDGEELTGSETNKTQEDDTAGLSDSMTKTYDIEMFKERLYELDVKFREFEYDTGESASEEFIEFVYTHNLYEINGSNTKLMIERGCKRNLDNELLTKFMSFILKQDNPLCEYMSNNMMYTMEAYFELYGGKISDPSEIVVDILNNETISSEVVYDYIERLTTKVDCLDDVEEKEYQKLLIRSGAVKYTGDNILSYYKNNSLDTYLIEFINSDNSKLTFSEDNNQDDITRLIEECDKNGVKLNV